MTVFDWIVVGTLCLGAIWGYSKGFINEISGMLSLLAGFFVVKFFRSDANYYLNELEQLSDYIFFVPIISGIVLFVLGFVSMKLIVFLFRKLVHTTPLKDFDKIAGLALGLTKWLICILIFIYAAIEYKLPEIYNIVVVSKSGLYLKGLADVLATIVL
ncbi:MAG: CvpA family protein [Cytophagales bacterium]